MVHEVESGRVRTDLEDLASSCSDLRFSPDGRLLAVTTWDRSLASDLVLCDLQTGRPVATEHLPSALGALPALAFSPDGRFLILASSRGPACQVRELPTGRLLNAPRLAATGSSAIALRPSDGVLLAIDTQGNVREWPSPAAQPAALDSGRILERAGKAALAASGRKLIVLNDPGDPNQPTQFTVYDVATGQVLRQFGQRLSGTLPTSTLSNPFVCSTQGSRLVLSIQAPDSGTLDHLEVWDFASGQRLLSLDQGALGGGLPSASYSVSAQDFDALGTRLAVRIRLTEPGPGGKGQDSPGSAVSVVELPSGRLIRTIPDTIPIRSLALRPDGKLLALATVQVSATGDSRVRVELRDPDSGQLVQTLRGNLASVGSLVFSADGRWLAAASYNLRSPSGSGPSPVEVWDLAAGAAPEPLHLDGHGFEVTGLAFSADGRRLATVATRSWSFDCELKLWDLTSGRDLVTWALSGGRPVDLAFDADGHRLRVLLSEVSTTDARVVLLDASPLAPEVEAIDLVDRLAAKLPLNSELAEQIKAEPGLDPAVRAAALAVVPLRQESGDRLRSRASTWLSLAGDRTPELMRRALIHIEHAHELVPDMDYLGLETLGEARYRNGRLAECLEPLRPVSRAPGAGQPAGREAGVSRPRLHRHGRGEAGPPRSGPGRAGRLPHPPRPGIRRLEGETSRRQAPRRSRGRDSRGLRRSACCGSHSLMKSGQIRREFKRWNRRSERLGRCALRTDRPKPAER